MQKFFSRKERQEAERKQKHKKGLIILQCARYVADLFRFVDTLYRLFRMML